MLNALKKNKYSGGIDSASMWASSQMGTYILDATKIVIVHSDLMDGPSLVSQIKKAMDEGYITEERALKLKGLAESSDIESNTLARKILDKCLNKKEKLK